MFDVVILAGGMGTRLRSVVSEQPKCLAPVAGHPFLYYLLEYLRPYSPARVVLSLGYMSSLVIDWIESVAAGYDFPIEYVVEETPLGTGGGIKLAMSRCTCTDVCVLNGDTMFRISLDSFYSLHKENAAAISLALKPMRDFSRYGTVDVAADYTVQAFGEKRPCAEGLINGGVYFISAGSGLFKGTSGKFSFEKDILEPFASRGLLKGFSFDDYFIDIGVPQDYSRAQIEFK